ncbi:MAG: ABC transporter substrate-binding protein [Rhodospirillales bacterium]|nr:ABC transporter substrate-binding protein [Rhodospirillales bacterium]
MTFKTTEIDLQKAGARHGFTWRFPGHPGPLIKLSWRLAVGFVLAVGLLFSSAPMAAGKTLKIAYFSKDVPGIDPLSPTFDPDSYAVITQIFDSLVYLDLDGNFQPGLATDWQQVSPTDWAFTLRRGVRFHNGEPFDARAVKFTYETVMDPAIKAGNAWILSSFQKVIPDPDDPYRVIIRTKYPDGMFLNRLSMFGSICPPDYIRRVGLKNFAEHPVGTGPYRFGQWHKGLSIELIRNKDYWRPDIPKIEKIRFEVIPESDWVDAFLAGKLDFIPNLAGNQTTHLMKKAKGQARILKRLVLSGYWVMLRNRGPLADRRVRQALNFALNKQALVRYADFGNAVPLASLGKRGEFGANDGLIPYAHSPKLARSLLRKADIEMPLKLTAIVADIASSVGKIIRHDFARIGIDLDLTVVPRAEWTRRVVGHKITHGQPADYDLAINLVDNPIHSLAFHAGLFLHSSSPWSLLNDARYDSRFIHALQTADPEIHRQRLEDLDRYIHKQALMVFTTQRVITAAVRPGVRIPKFSLNGHLDYLTLTTAEFK